MRARLFRSTTLLIAAAAMPALAQSPGRAVLQRMHDAYAGKWYSTLRFVQKTTAYRPDGSRVISTWYESLRHTSREGTQLRIDIGDPSTGNGVLYTADSTWVIRGGKLTTTRPSGNEFLPLIEGVYMQPVDTTARQVAAMHVDLGRTMKTTWQGRPTTVIGASSPSDSTSPQVWVDDERNVVVRALVALGPSGLADIHLDDYVQVGAGWLATHIAMASGGKPIQIEDYADWKVGIDLGGDMFNATAWTPRAHWANR